MLLAQYKLPFRKYIVTSVQQLAKLADTSTHCEYFVKYDCLDSQLLEGGVRVCGDAVLRYFWCGFAVIFILTRGIAVSKH